jgi:hypothetical protein
VPVRQGRCQGGLRGLRQWAGSDPRDGSALTKVTHHVRLARPTVAVGGASPLYLVAGILERRGVPSKPRQPCSVLVYK